MTRTIIVDIPHNKTEAEIKQRLAVGIVELKTKFGQAASGVQENWTGNHADFSWTVLGQTVTGRLDVREKDVHLEVDLPAMLAFLADKIKPRIEQEGRRMLDGPPPPKR